MPAIARPRAPSAPSSRASPPRGASSGSRQRRFSPPSARAARPGSRSARPTSRPPSPRATRPANARTFARRMRSATGCARTASCSRTPRPAQCGRPAEAGRRSSMRKVVWLTVGVLALALPAWSSDIYRWTDGAGGSAGEDRDPDADAYSASASLRRNALERDLRATEKRVRDLDAQLTKLARARGERSDAAKATSGVGTNLDVRSEEEKALVTEKEQLAQHAVQVRSDAAQLRQEVTQHTGGATPDWWVDIR